MRLSRLSLTLVTVALVSLTGCIENMGDLKEALGVVEPIVPAAIPDAPLAKAQANTTTPLAGIPVRFLSEGTRDPQALPLTFSWDFGDGALAEGPVAIHTYRQPGEYLARLTVTNAGGVQDEDTVALRVLSLDRAPALALRVTDGAGAATTRALAGDALTFDAVATDPEGQPLAIDWDFGDGATSHEITASHAYAAPGAYDVRVKATDAAGNAAVAAARVLVDGAWRAEGAFEPAGDASADTAFTVPLGAKNVVATLAFPSTLGVNDLEVVLLDAAGDEMARSDGTTAPAAQGDATREVELDAMDLASARSGAWTARVVLESGLSVEWTLDITVTM